MFSPVFVYISKNGATKGAGWNSFYIHMVGRSLWGFIKIAQKNRWFIHELWLVPQLSLKIKIKSMLVFPGRSIVRRAPHFASTLGRLPPRRRSPATLQGTCCGRRGRRRRVRGTCWSASYATRSAFAISLNVKSFTCEMLTQVFSVSAEGDYEDLSCGQTAAAIYDYEGGVTRFPFLKFGAHLSAFVTTNSFVFSPTQRLTTRSPSTPGISSPT